MNWRRFLLWTLLSCQLACTALLAVELLTDGRGVETGIYVAIETLRGWPPNEGSIDTLVRIGRFLLTWWFIGFMLLNFVVGIVTVIYAACEKCIPVWQRLFWIVAIWVAGLVLIPIYCLVALRRLKVPPLFPDNLDRGAVA